MKALPKLEILLPLEHLCLPVVLEQDHIGHLFL